MKVLEALDQPILAVNKGTNIAIQGGLGSYHDIAARQYFGNKIEPTCCDSFGALFQALSTEEVPFAIMAIENSVAGTLLPNYALLRDSPFTVIGERYLRIEHQLLTNEDQTIENITQVWSHPMALLQCGNYLSKYPHWEQVVTKDTALSAEEISITKAKGVAVIASKLAGELFGLKTLASNVEDNPRNFTRFLVLSKKGNQTTEVSESNKASICFHLDHSSGSLATALTLLSGFRMNLTKIQSLPYVGKEWQYYFFIDMEYTEYDSFERAMSRLKHVTNSLQILGTYRSGEKPEY